MNLTGTLTGALYSATRSWCAYSGSIATGVEAFELSVNWDEEKKTLGINGSPLLDMDGARDSDPSQHYVDFARLSADQAAGDAPSKCAELRMLAPTLTANAMK